MTSVHLKETTCCKKTFFPLPFFAVLGKCPCIYLVGSVTLAKEYVLQVASVACVPKDALCCDECSAR